MRLLPCSKRSRTDKEMQGPDGDMADSLSDAKADFRYSEAALCRKNVAESIAMKYPKRRAVRWGHKYGVPQARCGDDSPHCSSLCMQTTSKETFVHIPTAFTRRITAAWGRGLRHSLCALGMAGALWGGAGAAHAQSDTSLVLSALPLASMVAVASQGGASEDVLAAPLLVSGVGASLLVEGVDASAHGVVYVVKNVATGASAVLEVSGNAVGAASVGVGTVIQSSAIGAGVVLSAAGKVLAFIPNAVGKALMHNERL